MTPDLVSKMARAIREVPDFPSSGILFRDVSPILADKNLRALAVFELSRMWLPEHVDVVAGIESRGWWFGPLIADALHAGFLPIRKVGKLPPPTWTETYDLEYGTDTLEVAREQLEGKRVLIHDDLLATGGTANAAANLLVRAGAEPVGFSFLVSLAALEGHNVLSRISPNRVHSVFSFA